MPTLIVTYDLTAKPTDQYQDLYDCLKRSPRWWHFLESTWVVVTTESPTQLADRLRRHIAQADRLLVGVLSPPWQGWLPPEAWIWLDERKARPRKEQRRRLRRRRVA